MVEQLVERCSNREYIVSRLCQPILLVLLFLANGCAPLDTNRSDATARSRTTRTDLSRSFDSEPAKNHSVITIAGSTAATPMLQDLIAEFQRSEPDTVFKIRGGGSHLGEMQVYSNDADLAISTLFTVPETSPSSEISASELASETEQTETELVKTESVGRTTEDVVRTPIALSGLALIVHVNNPVSNLSLEEIKMLYSGRVTEWDEVANQQSTGEILLISREEASGTRILFDERVLAGERLSLTALIMPNSSAVIEAVGANETAIGYVDRAYVAHLLPDVSANAPEGSPRVAESGEALLRVLTVDGLQPDNSAIANQQYPLVYPLFIVQPAARPPFEHSSTQADVEKFTSWMVSETGLQIISRHHVLLR